MPTPEFGPNSPLPPQTPEGANVLIPPTLSSTDSFFSGLPQVFFQDPEERIASNSNRLNSQTDVQPHTSLSPEILQRVKLVIRMAAAQADRRTLRGVAEALGYSSHEQLRQLGWALGLNTIRDWEMHGVCPDKTRFDESRRPNAIAHEVPTLTDLGQASFWEIRENINRSSSAEAFITQVKPAEVVDFVVGCGEIYKLVQQTQPDIIFIPERGAAPLSWVLDVYEQLYGNGTSYPRMHISLGESIDVLKGSAYRVFSHTLQKNIILSAMSLVQKGEEWNDGRKIHNPLYIDEVKKGYNMAMFVPRLSQFLYDEFGCDLTVIAAEDNRRAWKKKPEYLAIAEGKHPHIRLLQTQLPLFTVNNMPLLNTIVYEAPSNPKKIQRRIPHVMQNTDAKSLFQAIATGVLNPDTLDKCLFQETTDGDSLNEMRHMIDKGLQIARETAQKSEKLPSSLISTWFSEVGRIARLRCGS